MVNLISGAAASMAAATKSTSEANPPDLGELHKAHIRVIAIQRNLNALLLQQRDLQQEMIRAEAEFRALRAKVQEETGLVYDDQTLALEPRGR